ncbi:MAG: AAA family ATPase [Paludibacteraceae bacterium]
MKFQQLTIHNIASIEDAKIDFEAQPLADSEVFLITGKTGSGKSTILDAICLALYADTPRLDSTNMQGETRDGDNKVQIDDPRQLMRRNTGEAFVALTFIGSNNVKYEAVWSVARARKKETGNIQSKNWQLTNRDTNHTLTKDAEIKAEIQNAIGLDFNQFCRTVMLAQGEFTRFLNSKDNEKAEILEKITGVDIYSKIGAKVYAITGQKEHAWQDAQRLVEGTLTLTDEEIAVKKETIANLDSRYNALKAASDSDTLKRNWLTTATDLQHQIRNAEDECRKAKETTESDAFRIKEQLINDWNTTIEPRQWKNACQRAENTKNEQQDTIRRLSENYIRLLCGLKYLEQAVEQATGQPFVSALIKAKEMADQAESEMAKWEDHVKKQDEEVSALQLPILRNQLEQTKDLLRNIETAKTNIQRLTESKNQRKAKIQSLEDLKKNIENKQKDADAKNDALSASKTEMDIRKEVFERQRDTIDKFAKTIRLRLHQGDTCPVCQQKIESDLPHEEILAALVKGLEDEYKAAEKTYQDILNTYNQLNAEINAAQDVYNRGNKELKEDITVSTAEQEALKACQRCGILALDDTTIRSLGALEEKTKSQKEQTENKLQAGETKEKQLKALRNTLDEKRKAFDECTTKLQQVEKTVNDYKNVVTIQKTITDAMPEWNTLSAPCAKEVLNLLSYANNLQNEVTVACALLTEATAQYDTNKTKLNAFLADNTSFTISRLNELDALAAEDIMLQTSALQQSRNAVIEKKTLYENAQKQWEEHQKSKPDFAEEDSIETLQQRIADYDTQLRTIGETKGAINKELTDDADNKKRLGALVQDAETKRTDWQKWVKLKDLIGDATGDKFRKIAQSYVLANLIHSANSYLQTLTNRYTLNVVPGTFVISLEDAYQGYIIAKKKNTIL